MTPSSKWLLRGEIMTPSAPLGWVDLAPYSGPTSLRDSLEVILTIRMPSVWFCMLHTHRHTHTCTHTLTYIHTIDKDDKRCIIHIILPFLVLSDTAIVIILDSGAFLVF